MCGAAIPKGTRFAVVLMEPKVSSDGKLYCEEKGTFVQSVLNVGLGTELRSQLVPLTIALITDRKIGLANLKIFVISRKLHINWLCVCYLINQKGENDK